MSGCCRRNCGNVHPHTAAQSLNAALSALVSMPLSPSVPRRALRHTRAINVQAFARDDGLWDIDAHISDIKTRDVTLASGVRAAGTPLHDLFLRITINRAFVIVDAEAASDAVPYHGFCDTIGPAYKGLIGLCLMQGFRLGVNERLAGVLGCTHLTELALILPTAALQAYANDVINTRDAANGDDLLPEKPYQLDRCHALRSDGAAVARFYPRWVAKAPPG